MSTAKLKVNCEQCSGTGFLHYMDEDDTITCPICGGEGKIEVSVTPVFEAILEPNELGSISRITIRIDDPVNCMDLDSVLTLLEEKFPEYHATHIISGFKQAIDIH